MVRMWTGKKREIESAFVRVRGGGGPKRGKKRNAKRRTSRDQRKRKSELSNWHYDYMRRNEVLQNLGYLGYGEYLTSRRWQVIRESVLKRDSRRCYGCGKCAIFVHHQSYSRETLTGEDLSKLVPVCRKCHKAIEYNEDGEKISLTAANNRLEAIRARTSRPRGEFL